MDVCGLVLLLFCSVVAVFCVKASAKKNGVSFSSEAMRILRDFHVSADDDVVEIDISKRRCSKKQVTNDSFKNSNIA